MRGSNRNNLIVAGITIFVLLVISVILGPVLLPGTLTGDTPTPLPLSTVVAVAELPVMYDQSGTNLGGGEARLYTPSDLVVGNNAEVMLEVFLTAPNPLLTLNPTASITPVLGTPHPTLTPAPLADRQYVLIHEFMGARLTGVNVGNFDVASFPPDGILQINPQGNNLWHWTITPKSDISVGMNDLQVEVYLQEKRDDVATSKVTNVMQFKINVDAAPIPLGNFFDTTVGRAAAVLGVFATFSAIVGTAYKGLQARKQRKSTKRKLKRSTST